MHIVSRYLVREFTSSSAAVLAGLLVTWMAGDSLRRLDEFAKGTREALRRISLVAIEILPYAVPLACLAGAVWTLSRATRNRELIAIRSGGISLRRALAPLLAAAGLVAVTLGFFVDRVLIPARIALERSAEAEPGAPRRLAGRWWVVREPWVFSAASYSASSRTLRDVTMLELDAEGHVVQRVDTDEARNVERDVWELRNAQVRSFSPDGGIANERHADLQLNLGVRGEQYERAAEPTQLSLHRMVRAWRESQPAQAAPLVAAFHARLLEPLAALILVLFAIPLGVGDAARGDSLPRALLQSLLWALGFWLCWTLAIFATRLPWMPAFAPTWAVVLAALGLGLWRYRRISE